ncbi:MAG: molybdopterin molybdotransferase MoeA [Thermoleophilia bacterium]|jgi:molybdopterin molybdotransferase
MTPEIVAPARGAAVTLDEAIESAICLAPATSSERVALADLAGRLLAEPVVARAAIPPFSNSAMDGYCIRARDAPGALRLTGESAAGRPGAGRVEAGETWRISTGAPLPEGADAVVRQEDVRAEGDVVHVASPVPPGTDVRHAGEDVAAGAVVFAPGHPVAPHEVGVIAAAGHAWATCRTPVRVAVLATGDELSSPGSPLSDGAIYESNTHGIAAQARAAGAEVTEIARIADDPAATAAAVRRLLGTGEDPSDPAILITIGGLSVGPHDHIRPALMGAGVTEVVPRIRARPGQPTWIGSRGRQVVLALPGNPVSAAICFHIFGRALLGRPPRWELRLPLARAVDKRAGLAQIIRCRFGPDGLEPLPRQGSAAISSLADVDALALLPAGAEALAAGTPLRVSPL